MDLAFQLFAVFAVLAAMGGGMWVLNRRRAPAADNAGLRLEARVPLTPNHSLHVVRLHGSQVLVATHPGGCSILPLPAESSQKEVQ